MLPFRQHRALAAQRPASALGLRQLLAPDEAVFLAGQFGTGGVGADDARVQEDHQVALFQALAVVAEQPSEARDVPQARHLIPCLHALFVHQPAEDQHLAVVDHHVGAQGAGIGDQVRGGARPRRDLRDLLFDLETDGVAFIDLRAHTQLHANVLAADGVEGLPGILDRPADDERHVLAHHDLGLLVVQRQQAGRGQDVARTVALQRADQDRHLGTAAAPDGAQGQTAPGIRWRRHVSVQKRPQSGSEL